MKIYLKWICEYSSNEFIKQIIYIHTIKKMEQYLVKPTISHLFICSLTYSPARSSIQPTIYHLDVPGQYQELGSEWYMSQKQSLHACIGLHFKFNNSKCHQENENGGMEVYPRQKASFTHSLSHLLTHLFISSS